MFRMETSVPATAIKDSSALKQQLSSIISQHLNKPEKFVQIILVPNQDMMMGGEPDKGCANCQLTSIGGLGVEENKKLCSLVFPLLEEHLGVAPDKIYVNFVDFERANVGWNGDTFHK